MKTQLRNALALLLALAMLLMAAPLAFAAEDATATITFIYGKGEDVTFLPEFTVTDGLAEAYGYTVPATDPCGNAVNGPTVLDALVAIHQQLFGEAFTKETATNYLKTSDQGYISKVGGVTTGNVGFAVNDQQVNDGVIGEYGTYTGFTASETVLKDGDTLNFFFFRDGYAMDLYPLITLSAETVATGEEITVTANGYSIGWYGSSNAETIEKNTMPLEDAVVMQFSDDLSSLTELATVDENGEAVIRFAEPGVYWIAVTGEEATDYASPVILNAMRVEVKLTYTVTFALDGGNIDGNTADVVITGLSEGDTITIPADPTKDGFVFKGWEPAVDETMPANDVTYTAQWEAEALPTYTVTFALDGGSIDGSTEDVVIAGLSEGDAITAPADPTKDGFVFKGWEPAVDETMPANDVTYTAQWEEAEAPSFLQRVINAVKSVAAKIIDFFRTLIDRITGVIGK